MNRNKTNKISKIIAFLLIIILLIGMLGVLYKCTNGFTEDIKTFYVVDENEQNISSGSDLDFKQGKSYRFGIKYVLDLNQANLKDFTVKIVANVKTTFNYEVDGQTYGCKAGMDLTSAFDLEKEQATFTLKIDNDMTMNKALEKLHPGKTVSAKIPANALERYPYALIVTSYNGKGTIKINFRINLKVTGVEFEDWELIF